MRQEFELPYFDEIGNEYVAEILKQDAFVRRGGKLSAPQMIKYDNRVDMLAERLLLILEAVREDPEALHDYLSSIEETHRSGRLPRRVYERFQERVHKAEEERIHRSERERDRQRVVRSRDQIDETSLSELSVDQLLERYHQRSISSEILFQQFNEREKAGIRLKRMSPELWARYRRWVARNRPNHK